jgi:lactate permease
MVCIHNIVAVCAVLGLANVEGEILKEAFLPMILYGITLAVVAALIF